jgi:hypothetical protein
MVSLKKPKTKKADVVEHPKAFDHVGLLSNEPPAQASCSLSSHPTTMNRSLAEARSKPYSPPRHCDCTARNEKSKWVPKFSQKMHPVDFHTGHSLRSSLSSLSQFAHRPALDLSDPLFGYAHRSSDLIQGQRLLATSKAKTTRANLSLPLVESLEDQSSRKTAGLK